MTDEPAPAEPYAQGFDAALSGATRAQCPYEPGTMAHARWLAGYAAAQHDDADEYDD